MVSDIEKTKTIKGKAEKHTEKLKKLTELIDVAKDAIIIRESNIKITFWNHGAEERYGWTKKEAEGKISHESLEEINDEVIKKGR